MTEAEAHAHRKSLVTAILLTCLAYATFNVSDVLLKLLGGRFHFTQVLFTNSCLIVLFLSAAGWMREGKKAFRTKKPKLLLLRALVTQVTAFCNVIALPHVRLTEFYTLVFTSPLWVALLSALFMKDRLGWRRAAVIAFGFGVVVWMFRPGAGPPSIWMLMVLLGIFAYSCQLLIVRRLGLGESRFFIFSSGSFLNLLIVTPFVAPHFVMPAPHEWALFAAMAGIGATGLLCISYAFQSAPSASAIAPYHYTQIIWGALLGWLVFQEVPDARVMLGSAALIVAGLYLVHHETRRPLLRVSGV